MGYEDNTINSANPLARFAHRSRYGFSLSMIEGRNNINLLDFGCGDGTFLSNASNKENTNTYVGFEPYMESIIKEKNIKIKDKGAGSLLSKLFTPLTNVYSNFLKIQDYNNDYMLDHLSADFKGDIHYIEFALEELSNEEITMSWHLTTKDKKRIYEQLNSKENQRAVKKIQELLLN